MRSEKEQKKNKFTDLPLLVLPTNRHAKMKEDDGNKYLKAAERKKTFHRIIPHSVMCT